eukprot:7164275-Pyramimonas_sp.AAC.1
MIDLNGVETCAPRLNATPPLHSSKHYWPPLGCGASARVRQPRCRRWSAPHGHQKGLRHQLRHRAA